MFRNNWFHLSIRRVPLSNPQGSENGKDLSRHSVVTEDLKNIDKTWGDENGPGKRV